MEEISTNMGHYNIINIINIINYVTGEDIVRTAENDESAELEDKEPLG